MKHYLPILSSALLLTCSVNPGAAQDSHTRISVIPGQQTTGALPGTTSKANQTTGKNEPAPAAPLQKLSGSGAEAPNSLPVIEQAPLFSTAISDSLAVYKNNPTADALAQLLGAIGNILSRPGNFKATAQSLNKANPGLAELGLKILDTANTRFIHFNKTPDKNLALVLWTESKPTIVQKGTRSKVVGTVTTLHNGVVQTASFASLKEVSRLGGRLILSGESLGGGLFLSALKLSDNAWREDPAFAASLPPFLSKDTSGTVSARSGNLIFNVARLIRVNNGGKEQIMPEAESATYKFLVRPTETGFSISSTVADEEPLKLVSQFMQLTAAGKLEQAKSLLVDGRMISLLKYVGLNGKALPPETRVAEMSTTAAIGSRYRLFNLGRNDLIFDVGKVKGVTVIKAIFIAPVEPFLGESARYFPLFLKQQDPPALETASVNTTVEKSNLPTANSTTAKTR